MSYLSCSSMAECLDRPVDEAALFGPEGWTLIPDYDRVHYLFWLEDELLRVYGEYPIVIPANCLEDDYLFYTGHVLPIPMGDTLEYLLPLFGWIAFHWGPPETFLMDRHDALLRAPGRDFYETDSGFSSAEASASGHDDTSGSSDSDDGDTDENEEALQELYGPGFIAWIPGEGEDDDMLGAEAIPGNGLPGPYDGHECAFTDVYGCPFVRDALLGLVEYPLEIPLPPGCLQNLSLICLDLGLDVEERSIRLVPHSYLVDFPASRVSAPACIFDDGDDTGDSGDEDGACGGGACGGGAAGMNVGCSLAVPNSPAVIITDRPQVWNMGEKSHQILIGSCIPFWNTACFHDFTD